MELLIWLFIACFFVYYKVMINEQNTPPNKAVRHVVISYPYLPYRTALLGAIDLFEQNSQTSKGTQIIRTEHQQGTVASEPV
jgi:hypothetical protein